MDQQPQPIPSPQEFLRTAPVYDDIDKVPLTLLERSSGYWRVYYDQKRKLHDVSVRHIIWGQIFTIVVVGVVSVLVEDNKQGLLLIGSTLILYLVLLIYLRLMRRYFLHLYIMI